MAGARVNNYSPSTTDLTSLMASVDATRLGFDGVTFTNYSTFALPAISAYSMCECGGSVYLFSTEEPISTTSVTSTSDAVWYVRLVPSSSQCTASFSTITPAWRSDYNGWYQSTSSINRYVAYAFKSSSSIYGIKKITQKMDVYSYVHLSSVRTGSTANYAPLPYTVVAQDIGGIYDTSSYAFVVPYTGYYHIDASVFTGQDFPTNRGLYLSVLKYPSSQIYAESLEIAPFGSTTTGTYVRPILSETLFFRAGEYFKITTTPVDRVGVGLVSTFTISTGTLSGAIWSFVRVTLV